MAPTTPTPVVTIDLKKKPGEQKLPLHNRWHPEIPPVATVKTGEIFRIEMLDWTGGAVKDDNSAADIKALDLSVVSKLHTNLFTVIETSTKTSTRGFLIDTR